MAVSGPGAIDRRDAAVAAALAGAVVVLVGYAAGLGITSTSAQTSPSPLPPAAPAPAGQAPGADDLTISAATPPIAAAAPVVSWPVGGSPAQHGVHDPSPAGPGHSPATTAPTTAPSPTPSPTPAPSPPDPTCREGLLDSLPVVGPLAVSALATVIGVVESLPEVPGSPIEPDDAGELVCPSTTTREVLP